MASFSKNSRYKDGELGEYNGQTIVFPPFYDFSNVDPIGKYTIQKEDEYRIDLISFKVYGVTDLGWLIMQYNLIDSIASLKQGVTLNIAPKELVA